MIFIQKFVRRMKYRKWKLVNGLVLGKLQLSWGLQDFNLSFNQNSLVFLHITLWAFIIRNSPKVHAQRRFARRLRALEMAIFLYFGVWPCYRWVEGHFLSKANLVMGLSFFSEFQFINFIFWSLVKCLIMKGFVNIEVTQNFEKNIKTIACSLNQDLLIEMHI